MDLGSRIQSLRKKAGLSQEALADTLGISRQALSKWESGASLPTLENLLQLSKVFEITLDELITGESPPPAGDTDSTAVRQETLEALLQHMESGRRKSGIWLTALCALFAAIALGAGIYAGMRTAFVESELQNMNQRIVEQNNTINTIYQNVQAQLNASVVEEENKNYSFSYELTGYDRAQNTLDITLTVIPREYNVDDTVEFLLTPHPGGRDTLEESIVVQAELQNGQYIATTEIPAVEDMEVYLRKIGPTGDALQERLGYACNMALSMIPRLTPDAHTFTFRRGFGEITMNGAPTIGVHLPESDPRGHNAKLICTLTHGDQIIYTRSYDLAEEFGEIEEHFDHTATEAPAEIAPATAITFYLDDDEYCEIPYDWQEDEKLTWTFQLVYDDGETFTEELSWRT